MKLGDLIKDSSWLSVEIVFSRIYPDQVSFLENYEAVFNELKVLKPKDSSITIIIRNVIDEFDNEEYVSLSGYDNLKVTKSKNLITESLALEFTPWAELLGMSIDQESIRSFTLHEIICHCLHEMTFMGFNQKEIDDEWQKIKKAADDFKHMTKEEKERNSMTLEELKKKYKYKDK
jgi:hypothetical protein